MPSLEEMDKSIIKGEGGSIIKHIIVVDDFMVELEESRKANRYMRDLVTRRSHHEQLSIIITCQVANPQKFRTISLNCRMFLFFQNKRDRSYLNLISKAYSPEHPGILLEAIKLATLNNKFGYICVDLHSETDAKLALRNFLFPDSSRIDLELYVS